MKEKRRKKIRCNSLRTSEKVRDMKKKEERENFENNWNSEGEKLTHIERT